jgi:hypothetical protein
MQSVRLVGSHRYASARAAVLEETRIGGEPYHVRSTPTLMRPDGTRLMPPIAFPVIRNRKIVAVRPLPCSAEACLEATRALFDQALRGASDLEETRQPGSDRAAEARC